jgi:hypothetical protein
MYRGLDFSRLGKHVSKAFTALSGDLLPQNDTVVADTFSTFTPVVPVGRVNSFETDADLAGVTAWNLNGDDFRWSILEDTAGTRTGRRALILRNNVTTGSNDVLMTSCWDVVKDSLYKVSFSYRTLNPVPAYMAISMLNIQNPADTGQLLLELNDVIQNSVYKDTSVTFFADSGGTKYLAFGVYTGANASIFLLDDVKFEKLRLVATKPKQDRTLRLVPNPASKSVQIEGLAGRQNVTFTITDMQGRVRATLAPNSNQLNLQGLAPGIYMVQANGSFVQRLVVQP